MRAFDWLSMTLAVLLAPAALAQESAADLHEEVAQITLTVQDLLHRPVAGTVVITQFRPAGAGPFPLVILNHGRSGTDRAQPARFRYTQQVRYFTARGFAVLVPTRIGYGALGISPDPEDSGACKNKSYAEMAAAASTEILAVLGYAKQQPYLDASRLLLVGQSVGGYTSIATAAQNPPGLMATINFAGGSGGDPVAHPSQPCEGYKLERMYANFGSTSKLPSLWIYTENDLYFGPRYSQAWHAAFVAAGGVAEFHLLPPFENNGHSLFTKGIALWTPVVQQFLEKNKILPIPAAPIKGTAP